MLGRRAGSFAGFTYSSAFAGLDIVWDEARLDAYLADPQRVIPGSVMLYRQPNTQTRREVISF